MRRFVIAVAIATAGALTVTACATSTTGHPVNVGGGTVPKFPTTTPHASTAPPATSQPSSSLPSTSPSTSQPSTGGGLTDQQAQAALLTATEIGAGFKAQPSDSKSSPPLCDPKAPPLDEQFTPSGKARTDLVSPDGLAYVSEEVIGYDSAATAGKSLSAGEKGLSCKTAKVMVNGRQVVYTIDPVRDVTGFITTNLSVPVDKSLDWTVHAKNLTFELIATKMGAQLVVLTFAASSKSTSKLPSEDSIVALALKKVKAHI